MLEDCESIRSDELWTFPRPELLGVPRKSNRSLNEPADSRVLHEQRGSLHFCALVLHCLRTKLVGELDELREERLLVFF